MRTSRPPRGGSPSHAVGGHSLDPAALRALLRATHLLGLALGSALGRLRESGATAARLFERAEESALPLRMTREAAEGHARLAPAAAVGGGRFDGEDRDGPRPLRVLPPASGSRRSDAGRDLFRTDTGAIPPPRSRPGEGPMDSPFRIVYLDAERLLPVLVRKAA
jgi:hypothetical protein